MEYFHHPSFDNPQEHGEILRDIVVTEDHLLTKEEEAHLFRQMNFFKYLITQAPKEEQQWLSRYQEVRTKLVTANMRLAKRGAKTTGKQLGMHPDELIGDAYLSLVIAVDKFNYNRNFRFSTYALWVIFRRFTRSKDAQRSKCADAAMLGRLPDRHHEEDDQEHNKEVVKHILENLDPRKRRVIRELMGIDGEKTNALVLGQRMGISDERVRQLKNRGIKILQEMAQKGELEIA